MNTPHTPGPWMATDNRQDDETINVHTWDGETGLLIAEIAHKRIIESEALANARLIAAAPDLLVACQKLVLWLRSIRGEDENLVIDHGFDDGFNLTEAEALIESITA